MFKVFSLLLLAVFVNGATLTISQGEIQAHTEVFGDSTINPSSKNVLSQLTMDEDNVESIKGMVTLSTASLQSDNKSRDEHMYELLETQKYPFISFKFTDMKKEGDNYLIKGDLSLNGVTKAIESKAQIDNTDNTLDIKGGFSLNLTDYNMEPPTLIFVTVRDQVDINYTLHYTKK